jgi:hypothetical protein
MNFNRFLEWLGIVALAIAIITGTVWLGLNLWPLSPWLAVSLTSVVVWIFAGIFSSI